MSEILRPGAVPRNKSVFSGNWPTVTRSISALALLIAPASALASEDLAKQLQNPIAALISVPFQFSYDDNIGPDDGSLLTLNVQPVIPFELSQSWNLISRTIVPLKWSDDLPDSNGDDGQDNGIGDIVQSLFFSPKAPSAGGWIWGVGPVLNIPVSEDTRYGPGVWAIGPTAVALRQVNGWTYGALVNHLWDVDDDTDISSTFLQPFLSYTTSEAWTFAINTESTYDWIAEQWNVPINLLVSKVLTVGGQPISIQAGPDIIPTPSRTARMTGVSASA